MHPIKHQDKIIKIIEMFFPQAKIYLFGSYARGDALSRSDIDLALDAGKKVDYRDIDTIKTMIAALDLIQDVDLVDFQRVPDYLQKSILDEGIVWKK